MENGTIINRHKTISAIGNFDFVRDDPRFNEMVKKVGNPERKGPS